ncbi:MAG: MFS transporter [Planctomycetes bacterium]|nr:MFS transporter [Planctomycetota bacterium]
MSRCGRLVVLAAAFLGWMFAGVEMAIFVPATRPAIEDFLRAAPAPIAAERLAVLADQWLSRYLTAFLLGAALGGALFGWLADRCGRVRALGLSIFCYSVVTGLSYLVTGPWQLLVLRFIACIGIGGLWPAAVALVAEAWPAVSRPTLAGLIGASANVGFLLLGLIMLRHPVTAESWRWVLLLGASPALLGVLVLLAVPESPGWLAARAALKTASRPSVLAAVFREPLLRRTLLGICLGTVPLLGGWASGQRLVPWAGEIDAGLKAGTQTALASGAVIGSLAGGWVASRLGPRTSYFAISLGSLGLSLGIFFGLQPGAPGFLEASFALGLVSTSFYGWLPWFLPSLFPTPVRATGAGVSFNWGRILSAAAMAASMPLSEVFRGDVALMAGTLSLVYVLGAALAFVIPRGEPPA